MQTVYIFNDFDKNGKTFYVLESINLFTANLGYLNILDLKPNEDVVFYHDCYVTTFNSKTVSISEVVERDYIFNISVEENRNFYANGILVETVKRVKYMKGFNGDTSILVKYSNGFVDIITLRELNRRFNNGELIQIMSFNEETKQNEWKNVTHSYVSDEKYKMNRMKLNVMGNMIYATGDVKFYTDFNGKNDDKYDEMMELQDNVHLVINDVINEYLFTSEFKLTKIDKVYQGYVNVLELLPNEDLIVLDDCYSSGGNGFDIAIDVLQDQVYNISVEENRNFYANGILVKQNTIWDFGETDKVLKVLGW